MSRIGKQPITIPENVSVIIKENLVTVKNNNLELAQTIPADIKVEVKDNLISVTKLKETRQAKALHGLIRSLINNMVIGVSEGFKKTLELHGTGYRVIAKGKGIEISLGFSHPVIFEPSEGVKVEVKDQTTIVISGADKQMVGETAATIRQFRTPDAYKGKGIRYQGEVVKLKAGKAAKAAEGN
jgi:large subunit ribosomal protein L6